MMNRRHFFLSAGAALAAALAPRDGRLFSQSPGADLPLPEPVSLAPNEMLGLQIEYRLPNGKRGIDHAVYQQKSPAEMRLVERQVRAAWGDTLIRLEWHPARMPSC